MFDLNILQFQVVTFEGSCPAIAFFLKMVSRFKSLYKCFHDYKPVFEALYNGLCSEFIPSMCKVRGT